MHESVRVDAVCADQHEVVVQVGSRAGGDFERFIAAGRRDDGIRRRYSGDNVLDNTLREGPRYAFDLELFRSRSRDII